MSDDIRKMINKVKNFKKFVNENSSDEIKTLQKELKELENWFGYHGYGKPGHEFWEDKVEEARKIRMKLYDLTGDLYGESKADKKNKNIKPSGLDDSYDYPTEVPTDVYKWITNKTSLLTTDASDAVRWSRIINSKDEARYPEGEMTIYRAVDNHEYDDIREGDWVTTEEKYAIEHNESYFNGEGKIISMEVNGIDVLVSPTGNQEEAIYAPLEYSIDVDL